MPMFRLAYLSPGPAAEPQSMVFEAPDAGAALREAFQHVGNRAADLWCDGQMLCRIECPDDSGSFWLIS